MLAPPFDAGGVKLTVAVVSPAATVPIVGAPGKTAFTVKVWLTVGAGIYISSPAWSALIVAVPDFKNVRTPSLVTVHTPVLEEVKVTGSPDEAVAVRVGDVPKFCVPGLAKLMVCEYFGVTLFEAADGEPVPSLFVAVTVNVYEVPFVSPVTVIGLEVPVPVNPPGLDVTV
jgi:hypothetical protein